MSNLMSKFRKKVTINIVDIFRFHIRRERGVDVVCHRASGHVPHILLTVFFRHADDIEVRRKGVFLSESVAGGFSRIPVALCLYGTAIAYEESGFSKNDLMWLCTENGTCGAV